eukprot:6204375-Pleurochrysis_carterae.AAC.3
MARSKGTKSQDDMGSNREKIKCRFARFQFLSCSQASAQLPHNRMPYAQFLGNARRSFQSLQNGQTSIAYIDLIHHWNINSSSVIDAASMHLARSGAMIRAQIRGAGAMHEGGGTSSGGAMAASKRRKSASCGFAVVGSSMRTCRWSVIHALSALSD